MAQKSQSSPFCQKICTPGISRMLVFILKWVFWISNPKFLGGKFGSKKLKLSVLPENWHTYCLERADSKSGVRFPKFRPQNQFLDKFGPKNHSLFILIWDWAAVFGHFSAAFYRRFWKDEVRIFLLYFLSRMYIIMLYI